MRKLLMVPVLMFAAACQSGGAPLSDDDVAAIRALGQSYAEAILAEDADGVAALYAEDATEMPPNRPAVIGRQAILQSYTAGFAAGMVSDEFTMSSDEVDGVDDLAYERGTWSWTGTPPGMTEAVTETGKHIVIARRQADGTWLWTEVIWNSDLPLGPPESATDEPAVE